MVGAWPASDCRPDGLNYGEKLFGSEADATRGRLAELDVGEWSALPHAEIARRWPLDYARFRAGALHLRPGGGETRRELAARVTAALGEIGARWPLARVGLVTHMGVLRALVPSARLGNAETIWLGGPGPAQGAWIGSEAL